MSEKQSKQDNSSNWPWTSLVMTLGIVISFGLAYSQAPLFTSNQNQYFLHGAADAGVGTLALDWLANTVDPTPIFSALVELTFRLNLPGLFHLYYIGLLGIYLYSVWGLLQESIKPAWTRNQRWIMLALLIAMHSFAFRFAISRVIGQEWRFILEGGFAGQRLLGTVFQPSTFGVLLLLGILLFLREKTFLGVSSVVLAATIHPTYLLSAALLILGFMLASLRSTRSYSQPLLIGLAALLLVSPILWYTWTNFQPTSPRLTELAAQILVEARIPNHILLDEWLDLTVSIQMALILISIYLFRKRPLGIIMASVAAAIFLLTFFQVASGNQRLALLFPWRPSALLVPLASISLLGYTTDRILKKSHSILEDFHRQIVFFVWILLISLAGLGIGSFIYDLNGRRQDTARPMLDFIQVNHRAGDRFFIPPKQQDFRLATGAPVFADFKSIPYVDTEVIDWYDRLRNARNFYRDSVNIRNCNQIEKAINIGAINHVVLGPDQYGLDCPIFSELVFSDNSYQVYKLNSGD